MRRFWAGVGHASCDAPCVRCLGFGLPFVAPSFGPPWDMEIEYGAVGKFSPRRLPFGLNLGPFHDPALGSRRAAAVEDRRRGGGGCGLFELSAPKTRGGRDRGRALWRERMAATAKNAAFQGLLRSLTVPITLWLIFMSWIFKAKRAAGDQTVTPSDLPSSDLTPGTWSNVAAPPSCATNGAISTISNGSKITYKFYG
jgi:hypothetical protein